MTSPQSLVTSEISEFRDPGKVNANTASLETLSALGFDSRLKTNQTNQTELLFEESLAGYRESIVLPNGARGRIPDGSTPAEYPNPLRAGVSADLMPWLPEHSRSTDYGVDATLLRRDSAPRRRQMLLGKSKRLDLNYSEAHALQNDKTNAYFRYRDLMKLGNSVTYQSNVFSIWITIGYFEVEPNEGPNGQQYFVDRAHPDGYRLGIEKGSDLGQVTRHRSFYVVDRSIPVAFDPGVNHNVENAIIFRKQLD